MQARTHNKDLLEWQNVKAHSPPVHLPPCRRRLKMLGAHLSDENMRAPGCQQPALCLRCWPYPHDACNYGAVAYTCAGSPYASVAPIGLAAALGAVMGWIMGRRYGAREVALKYLASDSETMAEARAAVAAKMKNKSTRWVRCSFLLDCATTCWLLMSGWLIAGENW